MENIPVSVDTIPINDKKDRLIYSHFITGCHYLIHDFFFKKEFNTVA